MGAFFRKPYAYTAVFSAVLTLFFLYTILLVFVIPRSSGGNHGIHTDPFTGTVDHDWGNNSPETDEDSAETQLFETDPNETYPLITDSLYMDENIRIEIIRLRRYDSDVYVADVRIKDPAYLSLIFSLGL